MSKNTASWPWRVLSIGEAERKCASEIVAFASQPKNYYVPGPQVQPPGDNPGYVAHFGDFRCVFSWTKLEGKVFRHLSISIPSANGTSFPNPALAYELALLFGFVGLFNDWFRHADPKTGGCDSCSRSVGYSDWVTWLHPRNELTYSMRNQVKCRGCHLPLPFKSVEDETGKTHLKSDSDWACLFCSGRVCTYCYATHTKSKHL